MSERKQIAMKEKLKEIIPTISWIEHTSCSIAADFSHYTVIASKGHHGCGYAKTILIQDKNINNEIIDVINDADELVELAYSNYESGVDESKKYFWNLIDKH